MVRSGARVAMVEAAERIVAERGLAALTMRAVQDASGQANKSAAQYHFGSRKGLLEAVIGHRMGPVDTRRREFLDTLEAADQPPTSRQLVDALVRPLAEATIGQHDSRYARFLAQAIFAPELADLIDKHLRAESFREVRRRLRALSPLSSELAERRIASIVSLTLVTLAAREPQHHSGRARAHLVTTDLVDTCVAAFCAPSTVPREGA